MTSMAGGGAVVAIAAAQRRRRMEAIVDAFRLADATSAARAASLDSLGVDTEQSELRELVREGVLARGMSDDTLYVHEAAYIAHRNARYHRARFAVILVVMIVLAVAAVGALTALRTR